MSFKYSIFNFQTHLQHQSNKLFNEFVQVTEKKKQKTNEIKTEIYSVEGNSLPIIFIPLRIFDAMLSIEIVFGFSRSRLQIFRMSDRNVADLFKN